MYKKEEVNSYKNRMKRTPAVNKEQGKRRHTRIEKPFITRFRLIEKDIQGKYVNSTRWDIVKMIDLSAGGMSFNYTEELEIGSTLEFNISLPFSQETVHCLGKVCRVDNLSRGGAATRIPVYGIAVSFIDLDKLLGRL